ncbi:hypothetical protein BGX23_007034 [Mortierella sp. AD031]|nr:hypothetical protein BGX23_007034 [Mortierella sp. AD031]
MVAGAARTRSQPQLQTLPVFLRPGQESSTDGNQNRKFDKLNRDERRRMEEGGWSASSTFSTEHAEQNPTRELNRYSDILPYKHSQVVVGGSYINANRITMPPPLRLSLPSSFEGYIATQAPLPETQATFWRMVKDQNVHVVVCLTVVSPDRRRRAAKAEQYWPRGGQTDTFGQDLAVRNLDDVDQNLEIVNRRFELWDPTAPGPRRQILLVHYQGWPDHGVPQETESIRTMLYTIRSWKHIQQTVNGHVGIFGPTLVHCSAGCGRTGTFCVVDTALSVLEHTRYPHLAPHPLRDEAQEQEQQAQEEQLAIAGDQQGAYDYTQDTDIIYEALDSFRKERMLMVQTPAQYRFCYSVVRDLCL